MSARGASSQSAKVRFPGATHQGVAGSGRGPWRAAALARALARPCRCGGPQGCGLTSGRPGRAADPALPQAAGRSAPGDPGPAARRRSGQRLRGPHRQRHPGLEEPLRHRGGPAPRRLAEPGVSSAGHARAACRARVRGQRPGSHDARDYDAADHLLGHVVGGGDRPGGESRRSVHPPADPREPPAALDGVARLRASPGLLENGDGFGMPLDLDDTFARLVAALDHGLPGVAADSQS